MSTRAADTSKHWGAPVPSHLKHGQNTYASRVYGCPCTSCLPTGRRTWKNTEGRDRPLTSAETSKAFREKVYGKVPPPRHGTVSALRTYGCRCEICKAAERRREAERRNRWRLTARGRWHDGPEITTICWPPKDAPSDWTCACQRQEVAA